MPQTPNNNNGFLGYGNFSSNGGRARGANITVDNATATDISTTGGSGLGTFPIDAVKEVSFITNNFNAEYGRNSSAQYQIVTKSGTNEFHGRLFEFFRNDKLNAAAFSTQQGTRTSPETMIGARSSAAVLLRTRYSGSARMSRRKCAARARR